MTAIANTLTELKSSFPDHVHYHLNLVDELIALEVHHPRVNAKLLLQGAQLVSCCPTDEKPLIWQSRLSECHTGKPLRGGIPICWPWFGDFSANPDAIREQIDTNSLPAHGFARNLPWQLVAVASTDSGVSAQLQLESSDVTPAYWPYPFRLTAKFELSNTLRMILTVTNLSQAPFAYSAALHSYFPVSSTERIKLQGFEGLTYIDTVGLWQRKTQTQALQICGEVDRIYQYTDRQYQIIDHDWGRRLVIDSTGSHSTVLWNPGVAKAKRLSTYADDEYREMLCIETANVLDDRITLSANETAQLELCIASHSD